MAPNPNKVQSLPEEKSFDDVSISRVDDKLSLKSSISDTESQKEEEYDPWGIIGEIEDDSPQWGELDGKGKAIRVVTIFLKIVGVFAALYFFICSIGLMSSAFQCLAGKTAGDIFTSPILKNPITGVIIGMLVTVLVQSSSTSTSIVVAMVGSGILQVHEAIYIIMGTNIGTSVTNTLVALTHALNVDQFRRAFAGATVHDLFNILNVLVLLPIEVLTGYLEKVSGSIVSGVGAEGGAEGGPELLDVIVDPLIDHVIQVNKSVIEFVAQGISLEDESSMIVIWCERAIANLTYVNDTACNGTVSPCNNITEEVYVGVEKCQTKDFLFANTGMTDAGVGTILLIISLVMLTLCLVMLVALLNSMLKGTTALIIKKVINNRLPFPFAWLTGYIAIIVGAILTFLVQSSSVFTSAMTPLVGIGVISLKRMYPLTIGSNIGTCTTSLLAALATDSSGIVYALQISICHFLFNITGIVCWYPIPLMRHVPIRGAKFLGKTTARYRWFAVAYLFGVFFIIPCVLLALSLAGVWVLGTVLVIVALIIILTIILNQLQRRCPQRLPSQLQTWEFLPLWMRSLQPYDEFFLKYLCRCSRFQPLDPNDDAICIENKDFDSEVTKL